MGIFTVSYELYSSLIMGWCFPIQENNPQALAPFNQGPRMKNIEDKIHINYIIKNYKCIFLKKDFLIFFYCSKVRGCSGPF